MIIVVILGLLGGGAYYWLAQSAFQVSIPKSQVQAKVDEKLPLSKSAGPLQYTVTRAVIDLRPDGRLAVDATVTLNLLGQQTDAKLLGSGVLDYRAGEFFLGQVAMEKLQIVESAQGSGLGALAKQFEGALQRYGGPILGAVLDKRPVFRLKQDNLRHNIAKFAIAKVEVRDQVLLVTLNPFNTP